MKASISGMICGSSFWRDWCGDVARNIPVVFRAMETAGIETEVLIMEENLDVMDQFLTMGARSIPVVIISDTGDMFSARGDRVRRMFRSL